MATGYIEMVEACSLTGNSKSTRWRIYAKRSEFLRSERTASGTFFKPYRIRIDAFYPLLLLVFSSFEKRRSPQLGPQTHFAENLSDFESVKL